LGSLVAGLADPQAKRDETWPCRTTAGGPGVRLADPPRKEATALAAAMVANPLADSEAELDRAAAEDDAGGGSLLPASGLRRYGLPAPVALGRLGRLRPPTGEGVAQQPPDGSHGRRAYRRPGHGPVSPLAGRTAAPGVRPGRGRRRARSATTRQPGPAAGGPRSSELPSTV